MIVFSGGRNLGYADNSRYLFEKFLEAYRGEFEILWVSRTEDVLHDTNIDGKMRSHMAYLYSPKGILSLLRARTIFFSWGSSDLPGTDFSRRTCVIQLWHGIPIKRFGVCAKTSDKDQIGSAAREYRKFTYWTCSSMIERNSIALCTGIPIDDVKITGYPRNDYLIEHKNLRDSEKLTRYPFLKKLVILYAPTYRSNCAVEFFPFDDFNKEQLETFLVRNDACLLLRAHHVDDVQPRNGAADFRSFDSDRVIILNRDSVRDVQDILPYVDILISDYSGIWVDFLLLDRPMVFVPYDLASYEKNDGLLYDYDYITPGPKVTRFGDMLRELEYASSNPSREFERRNQIKRMFHQYEDGKAYERIYQLVKDECYLG